jgi:hypothetical protein
MSQVTVAIGADGRPLSLIVNGWTILVHPLFVEQVTMLAAAVERARRSRRPTEWTPQKNARLRYAQRALPKPAGHLGQHDQDAARRYSLPNLNPPG